MVGPHRPMELIDLTLGDPAADLARDESLLRALEDDGRNGAALMEREVLRFWESPRPAVVVGRSGRVEDDVRLAACAEAAVPVHRRASGGGTVLLGPGCLCFSLVLAYELRPALRDVAGSYRVVLGHIARALAVPGLAVRGDADLALHGRKVSGNAQLRGRYGLLHQGTLLVGFDLTLLPRFLAEPARQPSYRRGRDHLDFVGNLPVSMSLAKSSLVESWSARPRAEPRFAY